jgi:sulfhydrogenase subunit alpha
MTHGRRPHGRTVTVPALARVEGEGGLEVVVRDGRVIEARLDIYEPPRFFEALLRGRGYTEPPDITARICGICPIAYQMSACQALEDACGVQVPGPIDTLRRLVYCGEWIESHALHIYLLHAPDFLGYESGLHMAREHPELLQRGLRLKKAGNRLIEVIGGRSVHPVNICLGGFYRAPARSDLRACAGELEQARQDALETVRWVAAFPFPDFSRDYNFVSLRHLDEYPITGGRIVSSQGLDITVREYDDHFTELQVPHSTALHSLLADGGTYLVGPMARYSLNSDRLSSLATDAARDAGLGPTCTNPFRSIIVRAVEILYACDEALRLIGDYDPPDPAHTAVPPREATGFGCTEAPRGLIYHRYQLSRDGTITDAKIVPPTSQNQRIIEDDLRAFVTDRLDLPHEQLTWECEQAIRSYDPCISCAAHCLDLRVQRVSSTVLGGGPDEYAAAVLRAGWREPATV